MESATGLLIQTAGVVLIAVLFVFMTRSIQRAFLGYWTAAWLCLSVSLIVLGIGFRFQSLRPFSYPIYFFFEYAFGFLLLAGCRNYAKVAKLKWRHLYLCVPAGAFACLLPTLSSDFNKLFIPHAAVLTSLFALSFRALRPSQLQGRSGPGRRVMLLALALLAFDFLHYIVLFSYVFVGHRALPLSYLRYTSIYDLIFEMLLGFGAVMLVMDHALREVEAANRELIEARDRLEVLAQIDPLTEALNRHAFYSLSRKEAELGGGGKRLRSRRGHRQSQTDQRLARSCRRR